MANNNRSKLNMILVLILLVVLVIDVGSVIDTRIKNTSRTNSSMDLNFVPTYTPPPTLKPTIIITQKPTKTTEPTITPTLKPTISPTPAPTSTPKPLATLKPTATSKPTSTQSLSSKMKMSISCSCSGYNHVGNEWYKYFSIDNIQVKSGDKITVTLGESIEIYTSITEDDKVPDVGSAWDNAIITQDYIKNGFSITQTIHVTENRGRYSGNTAVWTVIYKFTP